MRPPGVVDPPVDRDAVDLEPVVTAPPSGRPGTRSRSGTGTGSSRPALVTAPAARSLARSRSSRSARPPAIPAGARTNAAKSLRCNHIGWSTTSAWSADTTVVPLAPVAVQARTRCGGATSTWSATPDSQPQMASSPTRSTRRPGSASRLEQRARSPEHSGPSMSATTPSARRTSVVEIGHPLRGRVEERGQHRVAGRVAMGVQTELAAQPPGGVRRDVAPTPVPVAQPHVVDQRGPDRRRGRRRPAAASAQASGRTTSRSRTARSSPATGPSGPAHCSAQSAKPGRSSRASSGSARSTSSRCTTARSSSTPAAQRVSAPYRLTSASATTPISSGSSTREATEPGRARAAAGAQLVVHVRQGEVAQPRQVARLQPALGHGGPDQSEHRRRPPRPGRPRPARSRPARGPHACSSKLARRGLDGTEAARAAGARPPGARAGLRRRRAARRSPPAHARAAAAAARAPRGPPGRRPAAPAARRGPRGRRGSSASPASAT